MWFNNILVYTYQYTQPWNLLEVLAAESLTPCPPHARCTYGWVPPFEEQLSHELAGCALICLGKEERMLPKNVIQRQLTERVKKLEAERGSPVKRSERAQLAEDIEFELLPKAFCLQKKLFALFDTLNQRLIINTVSSTQAGQVLNILRKSLPGMHFEPLVAPQALAHSFTAWMNDPAQLPESFALASDCLLSSPEDEKKRFSCKGGELAEIQSLLAQGFNVMEISLIWQERLQFTLTQNLGIKRIKCLDYLQDEIHAIADMDGENQQLDATITLLSGELRSLLDAIHLKLLDGKIAHAVADAMVL